MTEASATDAIRNTQKTTMSGHKYAQKKDHMKISANHAMKGYYHIWKRYMSGEKKKPYLRNEENNAFHAA